MQVFHGGGAEDYEEAHPEGGTLVRDGLVRRALFGLIVWLEDDSVEKKRQEAQDKEELDEEDGQVLGVMLYAGAGLRGQDLINIMEVDATGKQQDHQKHAGDLFVMLIENIRDGFNLILRHGLS
jgi:hypothetical protein